MSSDYKTLYPWIEEDIRLSQDELDAKYNLDGEGEHPFFTVWDWIQAVAQRSTLSGYWAWLQYKLDSLYSTVLRGEAKMSYHQRIIVINYNETELPMFKTDAETNAFHQAVGRMVLYGMHGVRDEDCVELVTAQFSKNPTELDCAYWPRLPARIDNEDGSYRYIGSNSDKVDAAVKGLREEAHKYGRPFVVGAVLHGDGKWGFHS